MSMLQRPKRLSSTRPRDSSIKGGRRYSSNGWAVHAMPGCVTWQTAGFDRKGIASHLPSAVGVAMNSVGAASLARLVGLGMCNRMGSADLWE